MAIGDRGEQYIEDAGDELGSITRTKANGFMIQHSSTTCSTVHPSNVFVTSHLKTWSGEVRTSLVAFQ